MSDSLIRLSNNHYEVLECINEIINKIENTARQEEDDSSFSRKYDFERTMAFWQNAARNSSSSNSSSSSTKRDSLTIKRKTMDLLSKTFQEKKRSQLTRINAGQLDLSLQKSTVIVKKKLFSATAVEADEARKSLYSNKNTNHRKRSNCFLKQFLKSILLNASNETHQRNIVYTSGLSWILSTRSIYENSIYLSYIRKTLSRLPFNCYSKRYTELKNSEID